MSEVLLDIKNLDVKYGKLIHALVDVSIEVRKGEIVAILGSNGAGKTTLLKTISGLLRPARGSIKINGVDLSYEPAHKIIRHGVAHVPEGREVIPQFTVRENLMVGAYTADKNSIAERMEQVMELFPIVRERYSQPAGTLSGGEQQMLVIGRALMSNPSLLLLDEPSLGLSPVLVEKVMEMVSVINKTRGVTVLLIEQNAFIALEIANRGYVLENGKITMHGDARKMAEDDDLKKRYLAG